MTIPTLRITKYVHHPKADYVLPHSHSCCELIYYIQGTGMTTINSQSYKYKEDTLAIIAPDQSHDEHAYEKSVVVCCQFEDVLGMNFRTQVISKNDKNRIALDKIREIMLQIHFAFNNDRLNEGNNHALLWELNLYLFRLVNDDTVSRDDYFRNITAVAKRYIEKHFHQKIEYEILAEMMGYSYDRFRHLFLKYGGETLNEYRSNLRLGYAKNLLKKKHTQTKMVAKKCGFRDEMCFCKWFKKKMNLTPQEYQKIVDKEWHYGIYNTESNKEKDE